MASQGDRTLPLPYHDSQALLVSGTDAYYSKQALGLNVKAPKLTCVPFFYGQYEILQLISALTGMAVLLVRDKVTNIKSIFAAGNNSGGVLIQSSPNVHVCYLTQIDLSYLPNNDVCVVGCGDARIAFQTRDRAVYFSNALNSYQNVHDDGSINIYKRFEQCPFYHGKINLKQISYDNGSDVRLIAEDGRMWALGTWFGPQANYTVPTPVMTESRYGKVIMASRKLVVTTTGIFTINNFSNEHPPIYQVLEKSVNPSTVISIACNTQAYVILTSDKRVICRGHRFADIKHDKLVQVDKYHHEIIGIGSAPLSPVDYFVKVVVSTSEEFVLLSNEGKLYGFGPNYYHVFGCSGAKTDQLYPLTEFPQECHINNSNNSTNRMVIDICANSNAMNALIGVKNKHVNMFIKRKASPVFHDIKIQW